MASAALSLAYVLSLALAVAFGAWLMRKFAAPAVPLHAKVNAAFSYAACLQVAALVPIDVVATLASVGGAATGAADRVALGAVWRATYYYTVLAMLVILPIHGEYTNRGELSAARRLFEAIRFNALFYSVCGLLGAAGLVVLMALGRLQPEGVVGFVTGVSNATGLVVAIFVLGYGLVEIPKHLWRSGSARYMHRALLCSIAAEADKLEACHTELGLCVLAAVRLRQYVRPSDAARPHLDVVLAEVEAIGRGFSPSEASRDLFESNGCYDALDYDTPQGMAALHRRLKVAYGGYERAVAALRRSAAACVWYADVMANSRSEAHAFEGAAPRRGWLATDRGRAVEWWWKCLMRPWCLRAAAALAGGFSLLVISAEVLMSTGGCKSAFSAVIQQGYSCGHLENTAGVGALVALPLAYICWATFYGVFRLELFSVYSLVPTASDAYSLLTCALIMCRLTPPLAYNFLRMSCIDDGSCLTQYEAECATNADEAACEGSGAELALCKWSGEGEGAACALPESAHATFYTMFQNEIGRPMDEALPLINTVLNQYFPMVIVLHCGCLACGLYDRLCGLCFKSTRLRFQHDIVDDAGGAGAPTSPSLARAREIVEIARRALERGDGVGMVGDIIARTAAAPPGTAQAAVAAAGRGRAREQAPAPPGRVEMSPPGKGRAGAGAGNGTSGAKRSQSSRSQEVEEAKQRLMAAAAERSSKGGGGGQGSSRV